MGAAAAVAMAVKVAPEVEEMALLGSLGQMWVADMVQTVLVAVVEVEPLTLTALLYWELAMEVLAWLFFAFHRHRVQWGNH
jgi:hypothetical protein